MPVSKIDNADIQPLYRETNGDVCKNTDSSESSRDVDEPMKDIQGFM